MGVEKEVPKLSGYKLNQFGGVRRSKARVEKEVPKLSGYKLNQFGGVRGGEPSSLASPTRARTRFGSQGGKDGGRTSDVEDVPPEPEGEPADLQGSRDFLVSFYLGN